MSKLQFTRRTFLRSATATVAAVAATNVNTAFAQKAPKVLRIGYQKYGTLVLLKAKKSLEARFGPLGTEVTWTEFPGGVKVLEGLNLGSIDFGVAGDAPPVVAQAAGAPFYYVGFEPPTPEGEAILVKKDSPIKTPADLKGKRIATSRGGNVHYLSLRVLEKAGLKHTDVNWAFLFPADARSAFERGDLDAWAVWDPFLAEIQDTLDVRVLANGRDVNVANYQFYLATKQLTDGFPDATKIVLDEIERVDAEVKTDPKGVAATLAPTIGMKVAHVEKALLRMGYGVKPLTPEVIASQQQVADTFHAVGLIPKPIKVSEAVPGKSS